MFGPTAAAPAVRESCPEADRRAWVRYPCSLEASCHSISSVADVLWSARVEDISAGGLRLVVSRRFEAGTVLRVEVRNGIEHTPQIFLVRVMHALPQPSGDWALGCAFARELDNEDLRAFNAQKSKPVRPDCRAWVRFSCQVETSYSSSGEGDNERWLATVLNISPSGIGLRLGREFAASTLLNLELPTPQGESPRSILARVVYSTPQAEGEWVVGCAFNDELTEEELHELL